MILEVSIKEAFESSSPIVDVRSPGEFESGHIPSAINIPLFSDEERADVGTVYKQNSKVAATELGYEYVKPKLESFITRSRDVAPDGDLTVHCWRGGMRSKAFGKHLAENGFEVVRIVNGGYKAYRNFVLDELGRPFQLNVLGGYTGSGKTYMLHELKQIGEQIIDLEGLANHKGSAFGGIDQGKQPIVEQFENNLHMEISKLDRDKPIWVEDESHNIGSVKIPMPFYKQMRKAKLYFTDIPKEERAKHLVTEYAGCDSDELAGSIHRISRRLGGLREKHAIYYLKEENYYEVALITLAYYDKYYLRSMKKRAAETVIRIELPFVDPGQNSRLILREAKNMSEVKLTQYSHGAGCGCKISPNVLSQMLVTTQPEVDDDRLIVGNKSRDDAAVYDMGEGTGIISTTDFFMPIVDDPFTFGKIAATNAISDVYAMGGDPMLAIAILGWPVDKLPPEIAREVLEGARTTCAEAGIALSGGHSIDSPEPIFGLAVTGRVSLDKLKRNDTATAGCRLYLTKPLGVGIFSTAQKQGKLVDKHANLAPDSMMVLNRIGIELATIDGVRAMTDVTGFGLLGHLSEICEGSGVSADIEHSKVPVFDEVYGYIRQNCIPGGTHRNWESYGSEILLKDESDKLILCDPQTSGGLLIAVDEDDAEEVEKLLAAHDINPVSFGRLTEKSDFLVRVV